MRNPLCFLLLLLITGFFSGCDAYPNDPKHSLKEARENKLRVGYMQAPPWIFMEEGDIKGLEAEIVKGFAKEIGAEVEWVKGTEEELMPLLEAFELHMVVGGITKSTPWKKHVGLTNPYRKEKVFICSTEGGAVPEEIEDLQVGVKRGSAVGAYVKKKKGLPVYLDSLDTYSGLVAVYEYELDKIGCSRSELTIKTEAHVLAVPKGENNLLMTLEEYLNGAGY